MHQRPTAYAKVGIQFIFITLHKIYYQLYIYICDLGLDDNLFKTASKSASDGIYALLLKIYPI